MQGRLIPAPQNPEAGVTRLGRAVPCVETATRGFAPRSASGWWLKVPGDLPQLLVQGEQRRVGRDRSRQRHRVREPQRLIRSSEWLRPRDLSRPQSGAPDRAGAPGSRTRVKARAGIRADRYDCVRAAVVVRLAGGARRADAECRVASCVGFARALRVLVRPLLPARLGSSRHAACSRTRAARASSAVACSRACS
jgi:hypothetical protein